MEPRQSVKIADVAVGANHRSRMDEAGLGELADSIRQNGVLQPVIVRPLGVARGAERFELVAGHRRIKAAQMAGLAEIPAVVRELDDAQAAQVQLVENVQREDAHPLDETDGYLELMKYGLSLEDVAARVGKPRYYVARRVQLGQLVGAGRRAFRKGLLEASAAEALARVPDGATQRRAVAEALDGAGPGSPATGAEVSRMLRESFMLELAKAPFDPADPRLVEGAPACHLCPRRTGNAQDLFGDVKEKDLCTDPSCFARKRDASWAARKARHEAAGGKAVEGAPAKALFPHGGSTVYRGSGFVDLDVEAYELPGRVRTWRGHLGKHLEGPTTLARTPEGDVRELATGAQAAAAMKRAGIKPPSTSVGGLDPRAKARQKRERTQRLEQRALGEARLAAVLDAFDQRGKLLDLVRVLAHDDCGGGNFDALKHAARARAVECGGKGPHPMDAMRKWAEDKPAGALARFVLEVACFGYGLHYESDGGPGVGGRLTTLQFAARQLGVDLRKVRVGRAAPAGRRGNARPAGPARAKRAGGRSAGKGAKAARRLKA